MQGLLETFANAELTVSSGTSQALVDKMMHGEIDIAFVSLPVENSSISTDLLFSDEIVAIGHPKHPAAKERFISAAALAGEKLILGERGGNTRRMIDDFFHAANVRPNIVMELSRQEAINQMVENNLGVGIAGAKTVFREIREGRLVSWMIEGAGDQVGARPCTSPRRILLADRKGIRTALQGEFCRTGKGAQSEKIGSQSGTVVGCSVVRVRLLLILCVPLCSLW